MRHLKSMAQPIFHLNITRRTEVCFAPGAVQQVLLSKRQFGYLVQIIHPRNALYCCDEGQCPEGHGHPAHEVLRSSCDASSFQMSPASNTSKVRPVWGRYCYLLSMGGAVEIHGETRLDACHPPSIRVNAVTSLLLRLYLRCGGPKFEIWVQTNDVNLFRYEDLENPRGVKRHNLPIPPGATGGSVYSPRKAGTSYEN